MTTARHPVEMRADLRELVGYHSPQVDVAVRLNTNESPLPPPPAFVEELAAELRGLALNRYPDRQSRALREAIAQHHGVEPASVFCANGSNEVLQCLLLAYGGHGRRACVFEPTYALHSHIARITGTEVVSARRDRSLRLDLDVVARTVAASAPVITFLCSPNNPTGAAETPATVAAVLGMARGLVVLDEAYAQFSPWSALGWLGADPNAVAGAPPAGTERLVVVRTFSKTWSLAACRLGYLVADSAVVRACEAAALPYHVDAISQIAGRLALRHDAEMRDRVATLVAERDRLMTGLDGLGTETWPSDANFVLFRVRDLAARQVWEGLVARSVLVRDCSQWPGLEGCLRVSVGTAHENDVFLRELAGVLAEASPAAPARAAGRA